MTKKYSFTEKELEDLFIAIIYETREHQINKVMKKNCDLYAQYFKENKNDKNIIESLEDSYNISPNVKLSNKERMDYMLKLLNKENP